MTNALAYIGITAASVAAAKELLPGILAPYQDAILHAAQVLTQVAG